MARLNSETQKTLKQMTHTIIRGKKLVSKHPKQCTCKKCVSVRFNKASRKLFKQMIKESFDGGDSL